LPQLQWHRKNIVNPAIRDEIEKNLSYLITHKHSNLTLVVNPIIYAYLTKGFFVEEKNITVENQV
jgi:hypothetical protein